jgi:cAMP-specific phosphodiesterase
MEKKKGVAVQPMFDRAANNELAKGQIGFIDFVALKFFDGVVMKFFNGMGWTTENIRANREKWSSVLNI